MSRFNVRVYGILIQNNKVLLSDEQEYGQQFTKFPGGGVEFGEGLLDALKREFMEECNLEIEVGAHIYTTDFYEHSIFNDSQLLSVYYFVKALNSLEFAIKQNPFDFDCVKEPLQAFRWLDLDKLHIGDVTFNTDKKAIEALKVKLNI